MAAIIVVVVSRWSPSWSPQRPPEKGMLLVEVRPRGCKSGNAGPLPDIENTSRASGRAKPSPTHTQVNARKAEGEIAVCVRTGHGPPER